MTYYLCTLTPNKYTPRKIKKFIAGYYNKIANSYLGKKFGMTPMDVGSDNENIAAAGDDMSGGEKDPARFVARKENEDMQMRRKEEMMGDKRAVMITNNNVINKGGDNYSEVRGGDVNVHDTAQNPYYNPA